MLFIISKTVVQHYKAKYFKKKFLKNSLNWCL